MPSLPEIGTGAPEAKGEAAGEGPSISPFPGRGCTQTCEVMANVMVKADQDNHICRFIIRRQMSWKENMPRVI